MITFFKKLLLAEEDSELAKVSTQTWQYLFLALLFLLTRIIVAYIHSVNGQGLMDGAGNLALAEYIKAHGKLPLSEGFGRFFPGVPILIVGIDSYINQITVSGFIVVWTTALLAVLLFHYLFKDFRMSVIHTVFLPAWLSNTATILGEGTAICGYLLFLVAMRQRRFSPLQIFLFLISGYALICRPTIALLIFPFLLISTLSLKDKSRYSYLIFSSLLLPSLFLVYLFWAHSTTGALFPQLELQQKTFEYHSARSNGYYPEQTLTWPGYSLILGFFDASYVSALKKAINLVHVLIALVAAANLIVACRYATAGARNKAYYLPFAVSFFVVLLFTLMIGGPFGHTQFYRYLATHMNPIIIFALFERYHLRWPWIIALVALNTVAASFTGSVGPF